METTTDYYNESVLRKTCKERIICCKCMQKEKRKRRKDVLKAGWRVNVEGVGKEVE